MRHKARRLASRITWRRAETLIPGGHGDSPAEALEIRPRSGHDDRNRPQELYRLDASGPRTDERIAVSLCAAGLAEHLLDLCNVQFFSADHLA
jgi:hypothetical protein